MKQTITLAALGTLVCSVPANALNYAATGTVTNARNYTVRHPNQFAQGFTMFKLSVPLEGGCTWGFIDAADKNALAIVLAAKSAGTPLTITYDSNAPSPWGDTPVCAVLAIEMSP